MQNTTGTLQNDLELLRKENKKLHNEIVSLRKSLAMFCGIETRNDAVQDNTLDIILAKACTEMNVSVAEATSKTRQYDKCIARALFITYCHRHNMATLSEIGKAVNRDHSTVIHTLKLLGTDLLFKRKYEQFETQLNKQYAPVH